MTTIRTLPESSTSAPTPLPKETKSSGLFMIGLAMSVFIITLVFSEIMAFSRINEYIRVQKVVADDLTILDMSKINCYCFDDKSEWDKEHPTTFPELVKMLDEDSLSSKEKDEILKDNELRSHDCKLFVTYNTNSNVPYVTNQALALGQLPNFLQDKELTDSEKKRIANNTSVYNLGIFIDLIKDMPELNTLHPATFDTLLDSLVSAGKLGSSCAANCRIINTVCNPKRKLYVDYDYGELEVACDIVN